MGASIWSPQRILPEPFLHPEGITELKPQLFLPVTRPRFSQGPCAWWHHALLASLWPCLHAMWAWTVVEGGPDQVSVWMWGGALSASPHLLVCLPLYAEVLKTSVLDSGHPPGLGETWTLPPSGKPEGISPQLPAGGQGYLTGEFMPKNPIGRGQLLAVALPEGNLQ